MAVTIFVENTTSLILVLYIQGSIEGDATVAALNSWKLTSRSSADVLRFDESRDRIKKLEQDIKFWKGQLAVARSKEKIAVDAETFILECLDATNQELASKFYFFPFFHPYVSL